MHPLKPLPATGTALSHPFSQNSWQAASNQNEFVGSARPKDRKNKN